MRLSALRLLAVLAPLAFASAPTFAVPQIFFGQDNPRGALAASNAARNNFLSALPTFGTDPVEAFATGSANPLLTFGAAGVTATPTNAQVGSLGDAVSPTRTLENVNFAVNVTFTFSSPVAGFGFYQIAAGYTMGLSTTNNLSLLLENTLTSTSQTVAYQPGGISGGITNVLFFGVVDTASPFNRVTVQSSVATDGFGFDDLSVAPIQAIPEPSTLLFAALGLRLVSFAARRRRAA